jgi:hypothetical protein
MTISLKPNLQLIYVSDIGRSTTFYKTLFNSEPVFSSPRYVAFSAGGEALFAIWTGEIIPVLLRDSLKSVLWCHPVKI